jgi:hypothetical protein
MSRQYAPAFEKTKLNAKLRMAQFLLSEKTRRSAAAVFRLEAIRNFTECGGSKKRALST